MQFKNKEMQIKDKLINLEIFFINQKIKKKDA